MESKKAKGLHGMTFPHFDVLVKISEKDKVIGEVSETFTNDVKNIKVKMENELMIVDSDDDDDGGGGESNSKTHSMN